MYRIATLMCFAALVGCKSPKGDTRNDKQDYVLKMRADTLAELYKRKPETKAEIADAPGYAVFSNLATQILIVRSGHGYGCVTDNKSGQVTYMKMGEVGGGFGLRASDLRAVFVFYDKSLMRRFAQGGWEFGAEASASAKAGDDGGDAEAAGQSGGMKIYRLTETGVSIQTALTGTKYWRDKELN